MTDFRRARMALTQRYAALTAGLLAGVSVMLWLGVRAAWLAERDVELTREADWLSEFMAGAPPMDEVLEELGEVAVASQETVGLTLYGPDGRPTLRHGLLAHSELNADTTAGRPEGAPFYLHPPGGPTMRAVAVSLPGGGRAVLACGLRVLAASLKRLLLVLVATDALAVALTPLLGWHFAGSALRPVQQSYQRMRQFLADASHEMRTPLTAIIGEADVTLRKERQPAEYRETMECCASYARQMAAVVEDVLEISRTDAGVPILKTERVDLAGLARTEAAATADSIPSGPTVAYVGEDLAMVEGDARLLRRVVGNLVRNALEHALSATEVEVSVGLEGDGSQAVLTVSDDGNGIAAEHVPRIFDRFYRVPSGDGSRNPGTGLGLAIVDAIARAHGGRVDVQTEVGKGSLFVVRLPVQAGTRLAQAREVRA